MWTWPGRRDVAGFERFAQQVGRQPLLHPVEEAGEGAADAGALPGQPFLEGGWDAEVAGERVEGNAVGVDVGADQFHLVEAHAFGDRAA